MTENIEETQAADQEEPQQEVEASAPSTSAEAATAAVAEAKEPDSANHEAAKYRHQAKEARQELDQLRAQLPTLQRQIIESSLQGRLVNPSDFFRFASLEDVLADDGSVDLVKLQEATDALLREHQYLSRPVIPTGRPKLPKMYPVASRGRAKKSSSIDKAFGTGSDVTFGELLNRQGEHADSARPGKGRAGISLGQRDV